MSTTELTVFGWPDVLVASLAARYANVTRWTINRAVKEGELRPLGKRGRSWTFAKSEIDRWLTGVPIVSPVPTVPKPVRSAGGGDALERLERIRKGGPP